MAEVRISQLALPVLDPHVKHEFTVPNKMINDGNDVSFFLASTAYRDIWSFIFQLNASVFPRKEQPDTKGLESSTAFQLGGSDATFSPAVKNLSQLMKELTAIIQEAPPDTGPRRFGNISFRKWYELVEQRLPSILDRYLPPQTLNFGNKPNGEVTSRDELEVYLYGSFGSAQRLDYGTGHELSFLAFLAGIWKLGGFRSTEPGEEERDIVLGVIEPYLELIRRLILTYTLEPAGSHGVWGLDDHSFLPYIFGSAQLSPPISSPTDITDEGSLRGAPNPLDVAKKLAVERHRKTNMYFSAIGFIYDVKTGPFWEHSPILYDVSGVKAGWAKINKGMIKMYNAEVLSKYPVIQHFPFGSLFRWERDDKADAATQSIHTSSQPTRDARVPNNGPTREIKQEGTKAPWASGATPNAPGLTGLRGPGATRPGDHGPNRSRPMGSQNPQLASTVAPWAQTRGSGTNDPSHASMPTTQAPWARKPPPG